MQENLKIQKNKKIPTEKASLSSAEIAKTMEQKDTMAGKSDAIQDEEKRPADTNTNAINILNRPIPIKEYRYNKFERSGRLSRNRTKDSKGIFILQLSLSSF